MCSGGSVTDDCDGLPHSETPGSKLVRSSPGRIVARHVLPRPPAPRHPPCALTSLKLARFPCPVDQPRGALMYYPEVLRYAVVKVPAAPPASGGRPGLRHPGGAPLGCPAAPGRAPRLPRGRGPCRQIRTSLPARAARRSRARPPGRDSLEYITGPQPCQGPTTKLFNCLLQEGGEPAGPSPRADKGETPGRGRSPARGRCTVTTEQGSERAVHPSTRPNRTDLGPTRGKPGRPYFP